MPASVLAEDLVMSDNYTVDSNKTVDSITASDNKKTLTINSGYTLTISQPDYVKDSSIASAIKGTGTLSLENVKLTVTDNSNSRFNGSIILSGNTTVYAEHLTAFTGALNQKSSAGRIEVGENSKFIGGSGNIEEVRQEVYAQLSGSGRIELTENARSRISLMNAKNDFHGFFSLTNGSLDWSDGAADFFRDTETEFANVYLSATSDVTFKSLVMTGKSYISLSSNSTLALAGDKHLNLSDETNVVGTGTVDAFLTGDGSLIIGNGRYEAAVTLSATKGTHSYGGTITVNPQSTLTIAGAIKGTSGEINVYGLLDMTGDYSVSEGRINIINGGLANFGGELNAGYLNVDGTLYLFGNARTEVVAGSGIININTDKTLTISPEGKGDLVISNPFTGGGTLNIDRPEAGNVVFDGNSSDSSHVTLSLTNTFLNSSNAGAVLQNAGNTIINAGSVLTVDEDLSLGGLTLNGGRLSFEGGTLTADTVDIKSGSKLSIAYDLANFNIFDFQRPQEKQLIVANNSITGYVNLTTEATGLNASTVTQGGKEVAKLEWTKPQLVFSDDHKIISASFDLGVITLLDTEDIGYRIASASANNNILSSQLYGNGNITFSADSASGAHYIIKKTTNDPNKANIYTGITYVNSDKGPVVLEAQVDNAFGNTKLLSIGNYGTVEIGAETTQPDSGLATTVGGLEAANGGKLIINANSTLTVSGDQAGKEVHTNLITGDALYGTGTLNLVFTTLNVEGTKNYDDQGKQNFSGTIYIDRNSNLVLTGTEQNDANALANAKIIAANGGTIKTDFHRGVQQTLELNVKPQDSTTKWNLVIAGESNIRINSTLEGLGSIRFEKVGSGSPILSTSAAENLGDAAINLNNGSLGINIVSNRPIANTITGNETGKIELISYNKDIDISFNGSGTEAFFGTVKAVSAHLKRSGTWKQFTNAALILTGDNQNGNSEYVVDKLEQSTDAQKIRSLTAKDHAVVTFQTNQEDTDDQKPNIQKLTVTGALELQSGSSVNLSSRALESLQTQTSELNVLEQDTGAKTGLASAGSVSIAKNVALTVDKKAIADEQKKADIAPNIEGTYALSLDGANNTLSVVSKLESLNVKSGSLTLGTNSDDAEAATLSATISGAGGVTIDSGKPITLSATNSYTGVTTVTEKGQLNLTGLNALGSTTRLETASGATVFVKANQENVGELAVAGKLDVEAGKTLTFHGGSAADLTTHSENALSSTQKLTITGTSKIEGANDGLTGGVSILKGASAEINDVGGLGSGAVSLAGGITVRKASGTFANDLAGGGMLSLADGADLTLEKDVSGFVGSFSLAEGTALDVHSESQSLSLNVGGAGDFAFEGRGAAASQIAFTNSVFSGRAEFSNAEIRGSGYKAVASVLVLEDGASYLADSPDGLVLGGLEAGRGAKLVFTSAALPGTGSTHHDLTVSGAIILDEASVSVADGVVSGLERTAGKGNILEQDAGNQRVLLASGDSVELKGINTLLVMDDEGHVETGSSQEFEIHQVEIHPGEKNKIFGTYDYKLGTENGELFISYGLKSLRVDEGFLTLGTSAGAKDAELHASIGGDGGLRIESGEAISLKEGNSYSGGTEVVSGGLILDAEKALGNTTSLTSASGTSIAVNQSQTVNGKLDVKGSLDIAEGKTLTFQRGEIADLTTHGKNALASNQTLTITGTSRLEGANDGLRDGVVIDQGSTTTITHVDGLGSGIITINGTLTADLSGTDAGNVLDNAFSGAGTFQLTSSGSATITSDISTYEGNFDLAEDSSLTVRADEKVDSHTFKLGGFGDFYFTGEGAAPTQVQVENSKNSSFEGKATFGNVNIFASEYKASGSTLVLTNGSTYTADKAGLKLGGLTLENSDLVFESAAVPGTDKTETALTVADSLTLNNVTVTVGKDVVAGLSLEAGKGNLLEQDEGSDKVILATGKSVSLTVSGLWV